MTDRIDRGPDENLLHRTSYPPTLFGPARGGTRPVTDGPSSRGWRHLLYVLTRINMGLSADELYEIDLQNRIRRNPFGCYQIGVVGLKGGVGRTVVTVTLGSALSKMRGDGTLGVDADPNGGNLADRTGRRTAATMADLLAAMRLINYNDMRSYTSMNADQLAATGAHRPHHRFPVDQTARCGWLSSGDGYLLRARAVRVGVVLFGAVFVALVLAAF